MLYALRIKHFPAFLNGIFQIAACQSVAWTFIFVVALIAVAFPARGQNVDPPPAIRSTIDGNGVDLLTGQLHVAHPAISVGNPAQGGLSQQLVGPQSSDMWRMRDNFTGTINSNGTVYTVSLGAQSYSYSVSGSTFTSLQGDGSTLVQTEPPRVSRRLHHLRGWSNGNNKYTVSSRG